MQSRKFKKNYAIIMQTISVFITRANQLYDYPKCDEYIIPLIEARFKNAQREVETWDDEDFIQLMAIKVLFHTCFDVLSSGKMHIYRGQLDPSLPGDKLMYIVRQCLSYYLKHGIATREQVDDQMEMLVENIESVG